MQRTRPRALHIAFSCCAAFFLAGLATQAAAQSNLPLQEEVDLLVEPLVREVEAAIAGRPLEHQVQIVCALLEMFPKPVLAAVLQQWGHGSKQ